MKVGFIVDGKSEFEALPKLMPLLSTIDQFRPMRPVLATVSADAPIDTISFVVAEIIGTLANRNPDRVVVLWNREQRPECPGVLAQARWHGISRQSQGAHSLSVVGNDRMFENWLVAALPTLSHPSARFRLSKSDERLIVSDMADHTDALSLLKRSTAGREYDKVADSKRILAAANVDEIAANSRSFRRFLRCLGHPDYLHQSRSPRRP
ncbi:MAG: DUF4276 family protein [Chloroflexota bacterium]|nr:DUF4276 family protein [Chloroflexota bacterium]